MQNDNRNRIFLQRLLERKIAIDGDENIEAFRNRSGKQRAIAQPSPSAVPSSLHGR
ncbi:MAG: hypothetical protein ACYDC8_05110 [Gammaproteobacteria bacterium]